MHPLFSIISSQSGFIEMDLLQKMFLLVGHEKNVIYSKLVNNPFNVVVGPEEEEINCSVEENKLASGDNASSGQGSHTKSLSQNQIFKPIQKP